MDMYILPAEFINYPFNYSVHSPFDIVITVVHELGIRKQGIYRCRIEGSLPEEKGNKRQDLPGIVRSDIMGNLLPEISENDRQVNGIHLHQG